MQDLKSWSIRVELQPRSLEVIDEDRRILESYDYIDLAQKPPKSCQGCQFLHGQMYNRELLVCAVVHPYGQDNCPDYLN